MLLKKTLVKTLVALLLFGVLPCHANTDEVSKGLPEEVKVEKSEPDPCDVVLSLGDKELTFQQVKWLRPSTNVEQIARVANHWLDTELLYDEAVEREIQNSSKVKFLSDFTVKRTIANELVTQIRNSTEPTDEDVFELYEKTKEKDRSLKEPMYLSFTHIRTKTMEEAQAVIDRIENGENINELAKELSVYSDAKRGGKVKRFQANTVKNRIGNEFFKAIVSASEGDIIGPIAIKGGFYEVGRHEGKRESVIKPFEKVKGNLRESLRTSLKKKAYTDLINSLRDKANKKIEKTQWMVEMTEE